MPATTQHAAVARDLGYHNQPNPRNRLVAHGYSPEHLAPHAADVAAALLLYCCSFAGPASAAKASAIAAAASARVPARPLAAGKHALWIVQDLNRFLRGWGGYFRYGHCAHHLDQISNYAVERLGLFVAKRHKRARGYGLPVVVAWSPNRLGLTSLHGTVVSPRANKPWRARPNAVGERPR